MTATIPQFPVISGYTITEQLYLGSRTAVYRAVQTNQQLPMVIKVLQREYPTFGELVQFRNQYAIAKNLSIAGIVQPLSLETFGNGYALVMADWGGISLEQYIQQQPLDLTEKLAIAIQLADILHELHQNLVIHKDIKPANILIHPQSKQVKLIDFSIASLLPKETQEIQNPNVLEGTLAYLAPEQTGRMNRCIDYRSDFYAFGITLYQLFTSRLPFITDDPLELVHCHIAKIATPIHQVNTDVPEIVEAIVAKLMTKNAEDRYQSALGIKHDLTQCLSQWKETGSIVEFELAQRDLCDRFVIPEKLYGREAEVQTLLDAFERVSQGETELMLVAGFSGIGKTAVINEIHKPIVRQRGYFIKGKYDQFQRNIPFSAFVQAFRNLIGQLLSESDAQLANWKTEILAALGENGQVIVEVIPELERIIGPQPPAPELSGSAAQHRFNLLFQKFIQVFTTSAHPLVMFLDDLQWADSASLNLLQVLMSEASTGYLLILGAYRDNEVFPAHPLILTLKQIGQAGAIVHTIILNPLWEQTVNQLVADTLSCTTELAQPLTQLVYQKTKGNPFFTTQFLKALHEDGWIEFESAFGYWQCDMTAVRQLALTDDVVEFMAVQLQKLPIATQEVLKLAACIGNQFDLATLAIVCKQGQEEVSADLWRSLQDGLVIPETETYKFFQGDGVEVTDVEDIKIGYRFLHDRVQQAAYSLIPETEKQQTHLTIGRLLRSYMINPAGQQDYLFDILSHFSISTSLIADPEERREIAQLNLIGCQRAKLSTAYSTAMQYIQIALNFLTDYSWQTDYTFTLQVHETAAEIAYLNTEFHLAEQFIQTLLQHSQQAIDCIKAYEILVQLYIAQDRQLKAIETGLAALKVFEVDLIEHDDWQSHLPKLPSIKDLCERPAMQNAEYLAALRLLIAITPPTHHVKPDLFPAVVLTMVDLCDRAGYCSTCSIRLWNLWSSPLRGHW